MARWGQQLRQESRALARDTQTAIARSLLTNTAPPCLPAIAGVTEPFHAAVARDKLDPQFRSYRAWMEMLYSGNLTRDQVQMVINYRAAHHDIILGIPTVYGHNTREWGGFLSYGHGYGLLQHDFTREYLLLLHSLMAHQYTLGTWTAPETRLVDSNRFAAPYCSPAQMTVPLLARWMLVFEEPSADVVWLAKGTPRAWLEEGKTIAVSNAPTRWGSLSFSLRSHLQAGAVEARMAWESGTPDTVVKLRLRVPEGHRISSVTANGKPWDQFNAEDETVTLPPASRRATELSVRY